MIQLRTTALQNESVAISDTLILKRRSLIRHLPLSMPANMLIVEPSLWESNQCAGYFRQRPRQ